MADGFYSTADIPQEPQLRVSGGLSQRGQSLRGNVFLKPGKPRNSEEYGLKNRNAIDGKKGADSTVPGPEGPAGASVNVAQSTQGDANTYVALGTTETSVFTWTTPAAGKLIVNAPSTIVTDNGTAPDMNIVTLRLYIDAVLVCELKAGIIPPASQNFWASLTATWHGPVTAGQVVKLTTQCLTADAGLSMVATFGATLFK